MKRSVVFVLQARADTSIYTIEEHLIVSVSVHEKQRTDETYEEIRENFFYRFNKAAPNEANHRKLEKKTVFLNRLYRLLKAKRSGRPRKYVDDDVNGRLNESLERSPMKSTKKRLAKMQSPRTTLCRWMNYVEQFYRERFSESLVRSLLKCSGGASNCAWKIMVQVPKCYSFVNDINRPI
ncbi:hypothetical protein ANN_09742 [Periplaneta americana]|uniref:Uncharacterized protein n=1 Tax=Periplaneta americana TaxID=6978 RepID=A0ABQ8TMH2_PERAM|nr:hypothetical protein ANN_09742 [Periplaneta americana]